MATSIISVRMGHAAIQCVCGIATEAVRDPERRSVNNSPNLAPGHMPCDQTVFPFPSASTADLTAGRFAADSVSTTSDVFDSLVTRAAPTR